MKLFIINLYLIGFATAYKLPDGIKTCSRSQPNVAECISKGIDEALPLFASGDKSLGLPPIDPYRIEKLEIPPPPGSNNVQIHMVFKNADLYGMSRNVISNMTFDIDNGCHWDMHVYTTILNLIADYSMKGKLLVFPLNAHGKSNFTIINLRNEHKMWCEKYVKKGKTHIKIINYTMDMHPENVLYQLTDLFPTNKEIEKQIDITLNENSLLIFNEIRPALERAISSIFIAMANRVFDKIPFEEIVRF